MTSIQSEAAAVDAFFRLDGDLLEQVERAQAIAPTPRLHVLRAAVARFGLGGDPAAQLTAAKRLGGDGRDDSLVAAMEAMVGGDTVGAAERLVAHGQAYPDDQLAAFFRFGALFVSGVPGSRQRALALVEADAERLSGDWRFDSRLAVVREEQGRYDEARALAEGVLGEQPGCAHAAHIVAHVNYETGEHAEGIGWLDEWQRQHRIVLYNTHFPWHTALHALALGELDEALRRFEESIGPEALIDGGSLLWRCRLAGAAVQDAGRRAAAAAAPALEALPIPFAAFSACFALAAAGDADQLASLCRRLEADPRPAFADVVASVARALLAVVEGRAEDAVGIVEGLAGELPRVGGSHAQLEVVEDTLLHALVAAGRGEQAEPVLRARLQRRPHVLDERLLVAAIPA